MMKYLYSEKRLKHNSLIPNSNLSNRMLLTALPVRAVIFMLIKHLLQARQRKEPVAKNTLFTIIFYIKLVGDNVCHLL